jgi:flagellar assembly protein FliH
MFYSKPGLRPGVHSARDVDELIAAEWALDDLFAGPQPPRRRAGDLSPPDSREQDALVEAIAEASAQRERELHAEFERRLARERAEAYEEGRHEGEIAEAARLRTVVHAAEQALDDLRASEERWTNAVEENVCALAVAVARQIVGRELKSDAAVVADLVRHALTEFPIDQPVRIRVNPQDLATMSALIGADGAPLAIAGNRDARWLADALVAPGGCVVEGRDRIIDGRVDTGLERIYRRLTYSNA